jgi:hypothetical protein
MELKLHIFQISALMKISDQLDNPAVFYVERVAGTHRIGVWMGRIIKY